MPSDITTQVDISSLSLAGLGQFSTLLAALSADNVQPIAMLQLQDMGAALPTSGPVAKKVPDHLLRCKSRRIERLGIAIGWRKGDAASLMAQTAGGQAVALVVTCLWNIYGDETGQLLFELAPSLLPQSSCLSSPELLAQAANVLANKLGLIAFGTILAKQVCRIHDAYSYMKLQVPHGISHFIHQTWMIGLLGQISRALKDARGFLRVRGIHGMGYIVALVTTLFSDQCIVTIENTIIHKGELPCSISIEITTESVGISTGTPKVYFMERIENLGSIFGQHSKTPIYRSNHMERFAWEGHINASLHVYLQHKGLTNSPEIVKAVGLCALAISDIAYASTSVSRPNAIRKRPTFHLVSALSEQYRPLIHRRCEFCLGLKLPLEWPSLKTAWALLKKAMYAIVQAQSTNSEPNEQLDAIAFSELKGVVIRHIMSTFRNLFIHPCQEATYTIMDDEFPGGFFNTGCSLSEAEAIFEAKNLQWDCKEVLEQIMRTDSAMVLARSDGSATWLPATCLTLDYENISHNRQVRILDGQIIHNDRYYPKVTGKQHYDNWNDTPDLSTYRHIVPSSVGVYSDITIATREKIRELELQVTVTMPNQQCHQFSLSTSLNYLFALMRTTPCPHPRMTPLKAEYTSQVLVASILPQLTRPPSDPEFEAWNRIHIVQAAGNPLAQVLSQSPIPRQFHPSILCRGCCLNCAFEQAKERGAKRIIVS